MKTLLTFLFNLIFVSSVYGSNVTIQNNYDASSLISQADGTGHVFHIINNINSAGCCKRQTVAFDAETSKHMYKVPVGTIIAFDKVKTIKGTGYNKETGKFKAPSNGLYFFTWTFLTSKSNTVYIEAMVNNARRSITCAHSEGNAYDSASGFMVEQLKAEDEVWLRVFYKPAGFIHSQYSKFSGFQISQ